MKQPQASGSSAQSSEGSRHREAPKSVLSKRTRLLPTYCALVSPPSPAADYRNACIQLLFASESLRAHFITNSFEAGKLHLALGELFCRMQATGQANGPPANADPFHRKNVRGCALAHRAESFLDALLEAANCELCELSAKHWMPQKAKEIGRAHV